MSPRTELVLAFLFLALVSFVSGFAALSAVPSAKDPEWAGGLAVFLLALAPVLAWGGYRSQQE